MFELEEEFLVLEPLEALLQAVHIQELYHTAADQMSAEDKAGLRTIRDIKARAESLCSRLREMWRIGP